MEPGEASGQGEDGGRSPSQGEDKILTTQEIYVELESPSFPDILLEKEL